MRQLHPIADDLGTVLHEEVGRLPRHYREAVILCYLEGKTGDEAAALLKCPVGTIKSRLSWARNRLRDRLVKRGVATMVVASAIVAAETAEAAPESLMKETASLAMKFARGSAGEVPAAIVAMARKVILSMMLSKAKLAVVALAVGSAASGVVFVAKAGGQVPRDPLPSQGGGMKVEPVAIAPIGPKDKAVRAMLDKVVELKLPDDPTLEALIKAIKEAAKGANDNGPPIYIDPVGLQAAGCNISTKVEFATKKGPAGELLHDALRSIKLDYMVNDGLVTISSHEDIVDLRLEKIERQLEKLLETKAEARGKYGH